MEKNDIYLSSTNLSLHTAIADMLAFLEFNVIVIEPDQLAGSHLTGKTIIHCYTGTEADSDLLTNISSHLNLILITDDTTVDTVEIPLVNNTLKWPFGHERLQRLINKIMTRQQSTEGRRKTPSTQSIEGDSPAINEVKELINKVAITDASVLILGESGTGKEIAAHMIHRNSHRCNKPFVAINCGAIPRELLESELFGHEKGSFTGAISARSGRFEQANGGTLFLDEIGDMDFAMQVKLLRVLQENCYQRVGSNKTLHSDVRIIAATHRNLEHHISDGKFREDLYYRLNVFPIEMPALRERSSDLPLLINSMIRRLDRERGIFSISEAAIQQLQHYQWPGNVRELSNLVERLRVLYLDQEVQLEDLPDTFLEGSYCQNNSIQNSCNTAIVPDSYYIAHDTTSIHTLSLANKIAKKDTPVFLSGECGTGKEVLARHIHASSSRAGQPFVVINCALLAEQDLDKILLGEETLLQDGTVNVRKGKIEQAEGGTLLLDEILNMSTDLQAKMLRLLQSYELERVGGKTPVKVNIRIITTTQGDLHSAISDRTFREDLFYRLNVFPITISPLRERTGDILPIAEWYLQKITADNDQASSLSESTRSTLLASQWPGNVRELFNVIQRAVTLSDSPILESIQLETVTVEGNTTSPDADDCNSLNTGLRSHEQEMIIDALRAGKGSRKFAAEQLGISPRTLRYKLARMRDAGVQLPAS